MEFNYKNNENLRQQINFHFTANTIEINFYSMGLF